jgi:hypothetical protein
MKRVFGVVFFCVLVICVHGQTKSTKRGLAYGSNAPADLQVLSNGVSWWYNWYHQPESAVIDVYGNYGFDYVPMAWSSNFNKTAMHDFLQTHSDVKYILGWNEPNFLVQANLKPSQAAASWPGIEALADEFNLKIVGPAVNYCGSCVSENGVTYGDPVKYLDDFFAACADCRVDYIAVHCYMGNVASMQWYVSQFKKYGKPIWLTEFANWEGSPTLLNQEDYLIGAVDYLESDPDVFRYAWFTGRFNGAPYIGLLDGAGQLTELGGLYVNAPLHDENAMHAIPAKIEAENYNSMSGILIQMTGDVSGFANVGYIDANDWLSYGIDVPQAGTYYFYARIAGTQNASAKLLVNDQEIAALSIPSTGDWQNWKTIVVPLTLDAGKQMFKIKAVTSGFNINWMQFSSELVLGVDDESKRQAVYPNPLVADKLYIDAPEQYKSVEISDVCGRSFYNGRATEYIETNNFSSGSFIVKLQKHNGEMIVRKIIRS